MTSRTARPLLALGCAWTAALAMACGRSQAAMPAPPPASISGARLVVLLVIDQLPSRALDRYGAALHPDGLVRRSARRGVWIERVSFPYAGTYTAPGHAAIATGKPPRESGVAANQRWDRRRAKLVPWIDDGQHAVLGNPERSASPAGLRGDTVGDALRRATGGRSRVVSLSLKDRAAVLMGGHRADIAVWYDPALPGFTTSTYYAAATPEWLRRWTSRHPIERLLSPWSPTLSAAILDELAGPDAAPGESDWLGLGTTFPHDPRRSEKPYSALRALPALNDDLLALADAAVAEYGLGADEVPDLLAVSVSTIDYAGHAFGPDSWEYAEALVAVDRALGAWLDRLERRTSIAVVTTSDHGVTPLPERAAAGSGGRIDAVRLAQDLEASLAARLGPGEWIDAYAPPFVYLSALAEGRRTEALAAAIEYLTGRPDIAWAGTAETLLTVDAAVGGLDAAALRAAVELSIPAGGDGDIFVVPAPSHAVTEDEPRDRGTSHGSPWADDREVPVLFYGPGVAAGQRARAALAQERVAATLAALLRIGQQWSGAAPLPGLPRVAGGDRAGSWASR